MRWHVIEGGLKSRAGGRTVALNAPTALRAMSEDGEVDPVRPQLRAKSASMAAEVGLLEGRLMTARTFYVEIYCKVDLTALAFEAQLESVMEALQSEPGETDIDLGSSNLSAGFVEFSVHLRAQTVGEAVSRAVATVRSALHGLDHHTPGWEKIIAMLEQETAAVTKQGTSGRSAWQFVAELVARDYHTLTM